MPTWKDRIDADVGLAEFLCRRFDQSQGPGFTRGISRLPRPTHGTAQGIHDSHGTSALFGKQSKPLLQTKKQACEVDVQHALPFGWRDADGEAVGGYARRPHNCVEFGPDRLNLIKECVNLPSVTHVRLKRAALLTRVFDFANNSIG